MSDTFKAIVLGDTCDDEYVYGTVDRLSPEAPVPVLKYTRSEKTKGMAANVNNNLRSFGVATDLLTHKENIIKTRFIDENSGYQLMRMDEDKEVSPITAAQLRSSFIHFGGFDVMVISDYGKGFLPEDRMKEIIESFNGPIFVDTKKRKLYHKDNVFYKINKKEYDLLEKHEDMPHDTHMIVTMGSAGAKWAGITFMLESQVKVYDVTGAGDTFLAALVKRHLETKDLQVSIDYANRAAAMSVQHPGVYTLTQNDIGQL